MTICFYVAGGTLDNMCGMPLGLVLVSDRGCDICLPGFWGQEGLDVQHEPK